MSKICVHGLGYIGLPTATVFADAGHRVVGYDTDDERIAELESGVFPTDEPGLKRLFTKTRDSGHLELSSTPVEAEYHVIAVPTPLNERTKRADLSYVEAAAETVSDYLRPGDTVIVESTVPPGTTEDVVRPILEGSGQDAGTDFNLAHCPENVLPGNILAEIRHNDRVIGGIDESSVMAARRLYRSITRGDLRTIEDATAAEFAKVAQNAYRDANIAFANELSKLARDYGIDSRETIALANEHPRVDILRPGPGVGGHCLPIDPWFLGHDSDELDFVAKAREVNDGMVEYVTELLAAELDGLAGTKIAILGVAYKGNVSDVRESPGLRLGWTLEEWAESDASPQEGQTVEVAYHDPYVDSERIALQPLDDAIADADAIVIATDHDEYSDLDPASFRRGVNHPLVLDTRAILDAESWTDAGFDVVRL